MLLLIMAAAASLCRKRPRSSLEEDCDDCLPISKRINKLHIESTRRSQEGGPVNPNISPQQCYGGEPRPEVEPWQRGQLDSQNQLPCGTGNPNHVCSARQAGPSCAISSSSENMDNANNNDIFNESLNVVASVHGICSMEDIQGYDPELKEAENPHYFRANNLLYDAHLMRVTRTKSFHMLNS